MKVTMVEGTICAKCEHVKPNPQTGYHKCGINPKMNYVTGEMRHWNCEAKNTGNCSDYKPKAHGGNNEPK